MRSLLDIARLEEARCARGTSEVAVESLRIAGGIASRGAAGSWINTSVGLGMAGPVTAAEINTLVDWYESAGHPPQVEICPYVDESLPPLLAEAGFRLTRFEQVFFRDLHVDEVVAPQRGAPAGIALRCVADDEASAVREAAEIVAAGFAPEGTATRPEDIDLFERCARHERSTLVAAYEHGACVGAGFFESLGEIAALYGLAVAPHARRRGVQQALIAERLNLAARRGCTLATISGVPGMGTERNVRRFGFQAGYTRVILRKPK